MKGACVQVTLTPSPAAPLLPARKVHQLFSLYILPLSSIKQNLSTQGQDRVIGVPGVPASPRPDTLMLMGCRGSGQKAVQFDIPTFI